MLRREKDTVKKKGQSIMEFTFCMSVVFIMLYGTAMIFRWTGMDLAERRIAYEKTLSQDVKKNYGSCSEYYSNQPLGCTQPPEPPDYIPCDCKTRIPAEEGPVKQLDGYFYTPIKMNAVWNATW